MVVSKTIIKQNFDMDTLIANPYPIKTLEYIREISSRDLPVAGWGFVTGLLKVSAAMNMLAWARKNHKVLVNLFNLDRRFIYLDYFAPILMHLSGGVIINSGLVGECIRDKNWRKKSYTLLHQYRLDY